MTISQLYSTDISYIGNGVQKQFPIPFPFFTPATDVRAMLVTGSGGTRVETLLTYNIHFTVTASPSVGGSLTMVDAPAVGVTLLIYLAVAALQELDLNDQGRLPAERLERSLDKLTMISQQQGAAISRAVQVPIGEGSAEELIADLFTARNEAVASVVAAESAAAGAENSAAAAAESAALVDGMVSVLPAPIILPVGPGEQYATINEAISFCTDRYLPRWNDSGVGVEIRLAAGYEMREQVMIYNVNLGWITITSELMEVPVDNDAQTIGLVGNYPLFGCHNGSLPRIGTIFSVKNQAEENQSRPGVLLTFGSTGYIVNSCGFKNMSGTGLLVFSNSTCQGEDILISGVKGHGVHIHNGDGRMPRLSISNASINGVLVEQAGTASIDFASITGCGLDGLGVASAAIVNANNSTITNCGRYGISVAQSLLAAPVCTLAGIANHAVAATNSANVRVSNLTATKAGGNGIEATTGATVTANSADVSGALGSYGIRVAYGATIAFESGNAQKGASPSSADIQAMRGVIWGNNSTGGTSQAVNTITANGIIYR